MRYYLRIPKTKTVNLDSEMLRRLSWMTTLREKMRERLKEQSKTDKLTEAYLDELHWLRVYYEEHHTLFPETLEIEFIWKSAIASSLRDLMGAGAGDSDGGNVSGGDRSGSRLLGGHSLKQRRTQSNSLYMEMGFVLLSLAIVKSMSAYSKDEGAQGIEALKRASAELREAAGIFQYIIDQVLPYLAGVRLSVPDLTPDIQYMLQTLSLADSDRLSVRVWLRTDKNQKRTPNMPANMLLEIQQRYENASVSLRTLQSGESRSVSADVQNYMRDGQQLILAQAMVYLAQVNSDKQKFGNAIKRRKQSVHVETANKLLSGPVDALYSLYRRNNDTIGFELVPSSEELRAKLPSGRPLFSRAIVYTTQFDTANQAS
ncbi:hypothetical protein DL89DRAFT_266848 [Linderina pennispora]|uniref:pH-response regulator protein palC n=1 Tax=Linderina pennispora TaxID=61395 RepID=A0A1Y1WAX2_9FUNG|nr:uncharacterized protein DL89DRAFT_266848 [Linderina pennispora]ORX70681.1 hypothetical protein DL89DRAFT_266848 [Linderina pennispora]